MGICYGKNPSSVQSSLEPSEPPPPAPKSHPSPSPAAPSHSPYRFSPFWRSSSSSYAPSPAPSNNATPSRPPPRRPFPPPSPAKLIQSAFARRFGTTSSIPAPSVPEGEELHTSLNKTFGYSRNLDAKYELGNEIGRGHFGYTCLAKVKKGELKGESVAVKAISKPKMTTTIAIEDVRREVKILKALSGHQNVVKFYDACEDNNNVYIVMEYCEGGELLDRILSRGGSYSEEDAKVVITQILNIVAYCHLQGVVHRDLKPENFLFTSKDDDAHLKAIDFGLSDFVRPDERLNDIVGSAYYVAPEVLHRSYSTEADVWSIGVISYILLCGRRPFWARTESGIFKSVLKSPPSFDEAPWSSVSGEAVDFVKRLLRKDRHKRMSAVQALAHPWLRGVHSIPLDIMIYKSVKNYLKSPSLRQAALKALSKTLSNDELYYFQIQFMLLEPGKNGWITLDHFKSALSKHSTEAMKESKMFDLIGAMEALQLKKMNFGEFCAATIVVPQLEGHENWETQAQTAYQIFDTEANQVVIIDDLALELGIPASVPAHVVLHDWIRHNDGKLSFIGFMSLLRGMRAGPGSRTQRGRN